MKVLFTADLHIKTTQSNIPVDWQKNRYNKLFEKLLEESTIVDIVVIGGDIFDKIPNMEELELYFSLIKDFNKPTFIYDGNHEATKKGKTFLTNLKNVSNLVNSNIHILDKSCEMECIDFIPYCEIKTFNPKNFHNDLLCTHVRGNIPPHVKAEIDLKKLSKWKTVLAGDLHSYSNSQENILYPGSPLTITFHRELVDTGIIIFDTKTHKHEWVKFDLPQLLRKTVEKEEDILETKYHYTIYEIIGDINKLSKIKNNDLIDKQLQVKDYSSTLDMSNLNCLEDEITLYCKQILKLKDTDIGELIKVYHDYIKGAEMG